MDGYVPPEVSLASLTQGRKIGEGSFGEVYSATVEVEDAGGKKGAGKTTVGPENKQ
jgi:hypothetical protein